MLAAMFRSAPSIPPAKRDSNGCYFIDRNPDTFKANIILIVYDRQSFGRNLRPGPGSLVVKLPKLNFDLANLPNF